MARQPELKPGIAPKPKNHEPTMGQALSDEEAKNLKIPNPRRGGSGARK